MKSNFDNQNGQQSLEKLPEKNFFIKRVPGYDRYPEPPAGYTQVGYDRTSTKKTNFYYYAKIGSLKPAELIDHLEKHRKGLGGTNSLFTVDKNGRDVTIHSDSLGGWIGKKGRWIKALNKVLINGGRVNLKEDVTALSVRPYTLIPSGCKYIDRNHPLIEQFKAEIKERPHGRHQYTVKYYGGAGSAEKYYFLAKEEDWIKDWQQKIFAADSEILVQRVQREEAERQQYQADFADIQKHLNINFVSPDKIRDMAAVKQRLHTDPQYSAWLKGALRHVLSLDNPLRQDDDRINSRDLSWIGSDKICLANKCENIEEADEIYAKFKNLGDVRSLEESSNRYDVYLHMPGTVKPEELHQPAEVRAQIAAEQAAAEQAEAARQAEAERQAEELRQAELEKERQLAEELKMTPKKRDTFIANYSIINQLVLLPSLKSYAYEKDYGPVRLALQKDADSGQYQIMFVGCNDERETEILYPKGYMSSKIKSLDLSDGLLTALKRATAYFKREAEDDFSFDMAYLDEDYRASDYAANYQDYVKSLIS